MNQQRRHLLSLAVAVGLFAASGASCPWSSTAATPLLRVLPPSPNLDQIIQAVNHNSEQIHSLTASRAVLSGRNFPSLRAALAFQRPGRLRLKAETALGGSELDLGSNDTMFWFWIRRAQPPAIYYCTHEQFARCSARQILAIEPRWLIEALGMVQFEPGVQHQGPIPLAGNCVEIRTVRQTPAGPETRSVVVDAVYGVVMAERLYDCANRMVACAEASAHRRDPVTGLVVPTVVRIQSPPADLDITLDLGIPMVNRLGDNLAELWCPPNYSGYPPVNLCDPRAGCSPSPAPPGPQP